MSLSDSTGVWQGLATLGSDQLAVRANLVEIAGVLDGVLFLGDPHIGILSDVGSITGSRVGDTGNWTNDLGAAVTGTFSGDNFQGVLDLTRPDTSHVTATVHLARVPTRLPGFNPIAPGRLLDTRDNAGQPLGPGTEVNVAVSGMHGIPFDGVGAVVANITGTEALAAGYVTAWASGSARPPTSNLNLERPGQTAANLAIVPVGSDGYVKLFAQTGTHLVVDAFGWFSTESILQLTAAPTRVLDTRPDSVIGYSGPKPAPGAIVSVSLAGASGVPASGVAAAVVNITATEASGVGYLTAWAAGQPRPATSNLNVGAVGQTLCNLAIVPVSADSSINLFTQSGTHLVVDVFGWFATGAYDTSPPVPPDSSGNFVADPSFEYSPSIPSEASFRTVGKGSIGSWMISAGGVDIVGPAQGIAADGNHFIDLNGNSLGAGTLQQQVPTSPDRQYRVTFSLAGNPNGDPTIKELEVVFGSVRQQFVFDITGHTNDNLGWIQQSFVANPDCGSSTLLVLRSLTTGDKGPNIDAVTVVDAGPGTGCQSGGYQSVGPTRLLDTRPETSVGYTGNKPVSGSVVKVQIAGTPGIASSGVSAVAINITATEASGPGFITAWPSATPQPGTSNLNLDFAGQTRANYAIIPVGPDGAISLFTMSGTHLIVDAFGWFS